MIQINKNILKKLMAIADANDDDDYFYIKHIRTQVNAPNLMSTFEKSKHGILKSKMVLLASGLSKTEAGGLIFVSMPTTFLQLNGLMMNNG